MALRNDHLRQSKFAHNLEHVWPAATKLNECIEKWEYADSEPDETPFQLAMGTEGTFWEFLEEPGNAGRKRWFHETMMSYTRGPHDPKYVAQTGIWKSLPKGGLVVNVNMISIEFDD
jgi:hypothetical protein